MKRLNLPLYTFKIKNTEKDTLIFDDIRKKYIKLNPEEWVRQNFISFIHHDKKYPKSLIAIEKQIIINGLKKRFDILVFSSEGKPNIIVECKAPYVKITQKTFDQIAKYNLKLNANFLIITNGLEHYFCKLDNKNKKYIFLKDIPNYN